MAQTQTAKKPVAKAPPIAGRKDTPQGKPEVAAAKAGVHTSLVAIKKSALSIDVGPAVIAELSKTNAQEQEMHRLGEEIKAKRYDLLAKTTQAIVKAAKADDTIDLSAPFSGDPKKMNALNDRLGLALGFREIVKTEADKNGIQWEKIVAAKAVAKYFPMAGEDKETAEYKKKDTLRGNFLSMLKKCAQAAAAIIERDIVTKYDAKQGTLVISGPEVKKAFGQDNIALDEKKTRGEGDNKVELNQKPSFAALAVMGAEDHGAPTSAGAGNHRTTQISTAGAGAAGTAAKAAATMTADKAIIAIAKTFVATIERFKDKLTPEVTTALESVKNAVEVKLANG